MFSSKHTYNSNTEEYKNFISMCSYFNIYIDMRHQVDLKKQFNNLFTQLEVKNTNEFFRKIKKMKNEGWNSNIIKDFYKIGINNVNKP